MASAAVNNAVKNITAKIQKIPTKVRLYGFGGLVLVIGVLFIYFVHIPMTAQIKTLEKEVSDRQATIKTNDDRIRKLGELKAEVKMLQERLQLLTQQLPSGSEVSDLLRQIQNLVSKSGLTLKVWRPDPKPKVHSSGLYQEIPITLELSGGYHDLALFFDRVSKLTRIVNMLNLRLGSASMNKAGGMEIKINCTAMTFAAVEKKPDAAPAEKKAK